jgi:predicted 3-demethylubiquinone-9 3-methyltransferase (glyoxalase superfamily)
MTGGTKGNLTVDQKIAPFLWFDERIEEAVNFYVSVFPNSQILNIARQGDKALTATFILDGVEFMALNGGPQFTFTEAVSFFVQCKDQAEVDHYWNVLTADGGEESRCGWLKDKYGLSWQIVPNALGDYLGDPDPGRSGRSMQAMLQMGKIVIADLARAADAA